MRFNQLLALVGDSRAASVVEVVDDQPVIIYANSALAALFDTERGDLLGRDFRSFFVDKHVFETHKPFSDDRPSFSRLALISSQRINLNIEIHILFEDVGAPLFGIIVDKRGEQMIRPFDAFSRANDNSSKLNKVSIRRVPPAAIISLASPRE